MQRESDYAVPKGGECQREPVLLEASRAVFAAATHGRLGLTEIQAAAAAGRGKGTALGREFVAGGVVADDALEIVWALRKSRGVPGRGDDEREGEGETVHLLWS